jgi:hypothetical protein
MGKATALVWLTVALCCIAAPVARGQTLWAYYPINQDDFKDYSGNGHHGTPVDGAVAVADPARGWVASFNKEPAKPSRVNCGTADPSAGGELTVSVWAYWRGLNGNWQGMAGKSFSYTDRRWIFQLRDADGMIQWGGADNAGLHIFSTVAPRADEWQHVVGTCDGTTSRVYINGVVVGEGAGHFAPGADAANVTLGFGEDRTDYDESFNGLLDEIYILTRGLSTDQVQVLAKGVVPAFTKAREPNPADGTMNVGMPLFRWTAGDGARFHDVYLGTTPDLGPAQLVSPHGVLTMYYHTAPLAPGQTYYWRVDEIEIDGTTIHPGDVWSFTVQALTAYAPSPEDGTNDASPTPTLTWLPGQGATQHHVYFGTNQDEVKTGDKVTDKGLVAEPTFKPGDLQEARLYYWRVDEVVAGGAVRTGPVWSFRTYVLVDDFEKYTDQEGNSIFDTWVDGYTTGLNGSIVGNMTAVNGTFGETQIVHGGKQSMPMDYNNVNKPYYSEAEMQFPASQDGSSYDVDTLVVWVRGEATNSPEPLYIALKDTHGRTGVILHPDLKIVTMTEWTEWRIFLAEFLTTGVDITGIKNFIVGVGNRNAPVPGGSGRIYLDDLHAIKTMTIDPSQIPPGFDPSQIPPGFDPSQIPAGFDPNQIPPGLMPQ